MDKKHKADAKREARKVRKNQEVFPVATQSNCLLPHTNDEAAKLWDAGACGRTEVGAAEAQPIEGRSEDGELGTSR